jgi:amino acid ABC transporter membrane protein, PAAT family (TC 3.A.1.3.-)
VQIFLWYFVVGTVINSILAQSGFGQISPLWFGVMALAIFTGAYTAEIVRAGIQSVHRGQMEAARSLGMTYPRPCARSSCPRPSGASCRPWPAVHQPGQGFLAARRHLHPRTDQGLARGVSSSLQPFEIWIVCAILYLVLTFTLSMFVQHLERKAI